MKILLTFFVLFFTTSISFNSYGGLFDKTVCINTDAQLRKGIIYLPNKTEPFTGKNLCEYESGQYESEGEIKDGKRDGKWIRWHGNGQKEHEVNYKDVKLVSQTDYLYYENGQEFAELNYKDGKKDGKWTFWYKNGRKDEESYYKDGDLVNETIFKYNYLTGQITGQSYKDGKKDGKWTKWYKDGEKKYEKNYKDGKKDGKWTEWDENGQIKSEATYKDGECVSGDCD